VASIQSCHTVLQIPPWSQYWPVMAYSYLYLTWVWTEFWLHKPEGQTQFWKTKKCKVYLTYQNQPGSDFNKAASIRGQCFPIHNSIFVSKCTYLFFKLAPAISRAFTDKLYSHVWVMLQNDECSLKYISRHEKSVWHTCIMYLVLSVHECGTASKTFLNTAIEDWGNYKHFQHC
jgi:hypothetical protein